MCAKCCKAKHSDHYEAKNKGLSKEREREREMSIFEYNAVQANAIKMHTSKRGNEITSLIRPNGLKLIRHGVYYWPVVLS
jgi:hypothetical protein